MFHVTVPEKLNDELHFHDCLEINFILSGKGVNVIEDRRYTALPGQMYVINNLEHHMAFSEDALTMLVIVFDPSFVWKDHPMDYDYLKPFFNRNLYFSNCIKTCQPYYDELRSIVEKLEKEWQEKQEGYPLVIKAMLLYLLAMLYRHFKAQDAIGENVVQFRKSYDKIRDAVEFIHAHYDEPITLEQLSKKALMNRTYFSSYFKRMMGKSVFEYIECVRISQACRLLRTCAAHITDIAMETGFNSQSYFNKSFKKSMGCSPMAYRSKTEDNTNKTE